MALCELCGKEGNLFLAIVEGSQLQVCNQCSGYGKVIKRIQPEIKKKKKIITHTHPTAERQQPEEIIVKNYSQLIKLKREKLNLSQKEVAKKLNEKESVIHNIESARFEPSIKLAKKLEKFFQVTLVEEYTESSIKQEKSSSESYTMGDFIKVKK